MSLFLPSRMYRPAWALPRSRFDFDFLNDRYWGAPPAKHIINGVPGIWDSCAQGTSGAPTSSARWAYDTTGVFPTNGSGYRPGTGIWSLQDTINACLWSRTFTNAAWVATNCTIAMTQTGADGGANLAGLLTATAGSKTATFLQSITLASNQVIGSYWLKRITGTGTVEITVDGSTWTDVTSQFGTTGFTGRVSAAKQTVTNPVFGIRLGTNGDQIAIDYAQCEYAATPTNAALNLATPPMVTTTAPVERFNQFPSFNYVSGPNFNAGKLVINFFNSGNPYSVLIVASGDPAIGPASPKGLILVSDGSLQSSGGVGGEVFEFIAGPTTNTSNTGVAGLGNVNKMIGAADGGGSYACMNGGPVAHTAGSNALGSGMSHCVIGNNGSGTGGGPLNGYTQRVTIWPYVLTTGEMQRFTT